jgi:hypothetical protein
MSSPGRKCPPFVLPLEKMSSPRGGHVLPSKKSELCSMGGPLIIMVRVGETGVAKDFSPLFEYNKENKAKFGLEKVKKKSLLRAIEEADARG